MSAATTNKVGMRFIEQEIGDKISDIQEEIGILKYGGTLSKNIISNL